MKFNVQNYNKDYTWETDNDRVLCGKESKPQASIEEICDSMKSLLLYKNSLYGNAALEPKNIFYKGSATDSIKIRLDDKISRVMNCDELRINDIADIIGYLTLLLVSMGARKEDIEKLKD